MFGQVVGRQGVDVAVLQYNTISKNTASRSCGRRKDHPMPIGIAAFVSLQRWQVRIDIAALEYAITL